jgi:hypothetical protein
MSSASWALQRAIFAALSDNAAVAAAAGGIVRLYDAPPRGAAFPYIVFAEDSETRWATATEDGSEHILSLRVWSRAGGRQECKCIADAMRDALDDAALSLAGHALVELDFRKAVYEREGDGKTYCARLEFRAVTEPEA